MNFYNNNLNNLNIDFQTMCNNFTKNYYENMSKNGFVDNLIYFDEKSHCQINNDYFVGAYNILVKLAKNNIYRFIYLQNTGSIQYLNNMAIITMCGKCQLINFQNIIITDINFTETFILSNNGKITNYICFYY